MKKRNHLRKNARALFASLLLTVLLSMPSLTKADGNGPDTNVPVTSVNISDVKTEFDMPRVLRTGKRNDQAVNSLAINGFAIQPAEKRGLFKLSFDLPANAKVMYVRIVDGAGYDVFFRTVSDASGNYSQEVDLTGHPAGTYYFQVSCKGKTYVKKLIFN